MEIRKSFLYHTPIAHRGLHDETIPENSLSAFRRAIAEGYAIETDVRFTKDKQLILFHDEKMERLTGMKGRVSDYTYDELKKLSLKGTKEKIPLFVDFLALVKGQVPILVEIKHSGTLKGLVEQVVPLLKEYHEKYDAEYAIQSFNPLYVRKAKKLTKNIFCGQLASKGDKEDFLCAPHFWKLKSYLMQHLMMNFVSRPDFVSYNVECMPYKRAIKYSMKPHKLLLCWVIKSQEQYEKFKCVVDNVIFENIRPPKKTNFQIQSPCHLK